MTLALPVGHQTSIHLNLFVGIFSRGRRLFRVPHAVCVFPKNYSVCYLTGTFLIIHSVDDDSEDDDDDDDAAAVISPLDFSCRTETVKKDQPSSHTIGQMHTHAGFKSHFTAMKAIDQKCSNLHATPTPCIRKSCGGR